MIDINIVIDNSYFTLLNNKKSNLLYVQNQIYVRLGEKNYEIN